jgi:hypothetical protein
MKCIESSTRGIEWKKPWNGPSDPRARGNKNSFNFERIKEVGLMSFEA